MNLHSLKYCLFCCLAPLPLLYFIFHHYSTLSHLDELGKKIETIHVRKKEEERIQKKQHSLLVSLSESDPSYIDNHLETLVFLESEIKKLEALFSDTSTDVASENRLRFLKGESNHLLFAEEKMRTKDKIREVTEKQQHPVEIHEEDLKKLLSLIEGMTIWPYGPKEGRPQLLIQDLHLTKNHPAGQDSVFVLSMQLIKRENKDSLP